MSGLHSKCVNKEYTGSKDTKILHLSNMSNSNIQSKVLNVNDYHPVYYDDQFFIGRIIDINGDKVHMKFLHQTMGDTFSWPRKDDISWVNDKFIFFKPLTVIGHGPFFIKELSDVRVSYNATKRKFTGM